MLKYYNYDIVFQEIPDKVTLAINISCCPNHCKGCHSPWLWENVGYALSKRSLQTLIDKYKGLINCICFMGGDHSPQEIEEMAIFVHSYSKDLCVAWYSGKDEISQNISQENFDYIKIGSYKEALGGLKQKTTNQRLYKVISKDKGKEDITFKFWR